MSPESLSVADIDRPAHKRAATRLGWYVHAAARSLVSVRLAKHGAATNILQTHPLT